MAAPRKYSGQRSTAARKIAAALLPCACYRCGRMVTADMQWNADHPVARVQAEAAGIAQHEQDRTVVPSHRSCDAKAGADLGNAMKARPRTIQRKITPIKRNVEFLIEDEESPARATRFISPEATGAP